MSINTKSLDIFVCACGCMWMRVGGKKEATRQRGNEAKRQKRQTQAKIGLKREDVDEGIE